MKKILVWSLFLAILFLGNENAMAQSPPEPGGEPGGETPLGGGAAPLGAGTALLVVLSAAYGIRKLKDNSK